MTLCHIQFDKTEEQSINTPTFTSGTVKLSRIASMVHCVLLCGEHDCCACLTSVELCSLKARKVLCGYVNSPSHTVTIATIMTHSMSIL